MKERDRPFFSIVIPCYNSRETIGRLLKSIVNQRMSFKDIQVVISDDCSTESYTDIVDQFRDKLFITQVKTDYNYCPGNTRQRGIDNAIGRWVIFSDHDDQFISDTFPKVKKDIQQNGKIDTVYITRFYQRLKDNKLVSMNPLAGWTHGKFFNLDHFWKKYNIHYPKDLTSHQDCCINAQMQYVRRVYNLEYYITELPTYIWHSNPDSLSNRKYVQAQKERIFLDVFLIDYMYSTAGAIYDIYKEVQQQRQYVANNIKNVLLYSYFYFEYAKYRVPQYLKKNCDEVRKYIALLKDQFNCSIEQIYDYFRTQDTENYKTIFSMAMTQTDCFIYQKSFKEWLYWIWNKEY